MGGNVIFISKLGQDIFGDKYNALLKNENIDSRYIFSDPSQPSGIALIMVDRDGENSIVVAPGANSALKTADIKKAQNEFKEAAFLLLQLEIPMETVIYSATKASEEGIKVLLNPAPANELPEELLSSVYILTPNETEAGIISGITVNDLDSARSAARVIRDKGVDIVVITMGEKGAYIFSGNMEKHVPGYKVKANDTTAAGDVFNGALVVALAEKFSLYKAVEFANKAASFSVTKLGAQSSAPYRNELS